MLQGNMVSDRARVSSSVKQASKSTSAMGRPSLLQPDPARYFPNGTRMAQACCEGTPSSQNLTSKAPNDTKPFTLRYTNIFEPKTGHPSLVSDTVHLVEIIHIAMAGSTIVSVMSLNPTSWVSKASSSSRYDWYTAMISQGAWV